VAGCCEHVVRHSYGQITELCFCTYFGQVLTESNICLSLLFSVDIELDMSNGVCL